MSNPSKLIVLDKAHSLLQDLNEAVERMRKPHLADLKKQLIKTAVSIVSNIAEGRRRESQREFLNFLNIALGSTGELETQLRAANDCHALPASTHDELAKRAEEVGKMLSGLKRRIMEDLNGEES
ncbi:MAG TPA: four helix bundle protein [Gemmatimonadaceae bacterium]|jgi:four helix bundle protein|nr:four helix bundle protein [Gemmatimonadaceae bacterium]